MSAVPEVIEREPIANYAMTPMAVMARAMERGSLTIEQMNALLDAQERVNRDEARKAFAEAMVQFKSKPIEIRKNKRVLYKNKMGGHTDYTHATLDEVCDKIISKLAEVGISHRWVPEQKGNIMRITCVLTHKLGHSESTALEGPNDDSGGKNAIQGIGSAAHYLERYTVLAATGLAVKDSDQDDDGIATGPRKAAPGEIYRVEPTTVVEGPTARQAPAPQEETPPPPAPNSPPMSEGQRRIIRAKLVNANLSDRDLQKVFGKGLDHPSWVSSDFKEVTLWIAHPKK